MLFIINILKLLSCNRLHFLVQYTVCNYKKKEKNNKKTVFYADASKARPFNANDYHSTFIENKRTRRADTTGCAPYG